MKCPRCGAIVIERTGFCDRCGARLRMWAAGREYARVVGIIGGDALLLATGEVVRYIGVRAPHAGEGADEWAEQAAERNGELALGLHVLLETDEQRTDSSGRLWRYVWLNERELLNETLVAEGYAIARALAPNEEHQRRLERAQYAARLADRGLWSDPAGVAWGALPPPIPADEDFVETLTAEGVADPEEGSKVPPLADVPPVMATPPRPALVLTETRHIVPRAPRPKLRLPLVTSVLAVAVLALGVVFSERLPDVTATPKAWARAAFTRPTATATVFTTPPTDNADTLLAEATGLLQSKEYVLAKQVVSEVLASGAERWQAYAIRAQANTQLGTLSEAETDYSKAIALAPQIEQGRLYAGRGGVRTRLGDYTGARADFIAAQEAPDPEIQSVAQTWLAANPAPTATAAPSPTITATAKPASTVTVTVTVTATAAPPTLTPSPTATPDVREPAVLSIAPVYPIAFEKAYFKQEVGAPSQTSLRWIFRGASQDEIDEMLGRPNIYFDIQLCRLPGSQSQCDPSDWMGVMWLRPAEALKQRSTWGQEYAVSTTYFMNWGMEPGAYNWRVRVIEGKDGKVTRVLVDTGNPVYARLQSVGENEPAFTFSR